MRQAGMGRADTDRRVRLYAVPFSWLSGENGNVVKPSAMGHARFMSLVNLVRGRGEVVAAKSWG